MKVPEPENEIPIAWNAIEQHEEVFAADGERVGTVDEVLGGEPEDIFHGIVLRPGLVDQPVVVPADAIRSITNRRIELALPGSQVHELPAYVEEDSYKLGWKGLFGKVIGWTQEGKQ